MAKKETQTAAVITVKRRAWLDDDRPSVVVAKAAAEKKRQKEEARRKKEEEEARIRSRLAEKLEASKASWAVGRLSTSPIIPSRMSAPSSIPLDPTAAPEEPSVLGPLRVETITPTHVWRPTDAELRDGMRNLAYGNRPNGYADYVRSFGNHIGNFDLFRFAEAMPNEEHGVPLYQTNEIPEHYGVVAIDSASVGGQIRNGRVMVSINLLNATLRSESGGIPGRRLDLSEVRRVRSQDYGTSFNISHMDAPSSIFYLFDPGQVAVWRGVLPDFMSRIIQGFALMRINDPAMRPFVWNHHLLNDMVNGRQIWARAGLQRDNAEIICNQIEGANVVDTSRGYDLFNFGMPHRVMDTMGIPRAATRGYYG